MFQTVDLAGRYSVPSLRDPVSDAGYDDIVPQDGASSRLPILACPDNLVHEANGCTSLEGIGPVSTFVYKGFDRLGHKKAGTIVAPTNQDARRDLRERGLNPYFVEDYHAVKKLVRHRRKRRRILMGIGAVAIAIALVVSGMMVGYAGRPQAPDIAQYRDVGLADVIVAESPEGEALGANILDAWESLVPGVVTGIEVKKYFMIVYVGRSVRRVSDNDLEALATNTAHALQRTFKSSGATLYVVEDDLTIMEVRYNPYTRSTTVTPYR